MRLTELEPSFLRFEEDDFASKTYRMTDEIAGAQGLMFVCPKCFAGKGNSRPGAHSIICWAPVVPQHVAPMPGRWEMLGTGYHDLTLRAGSSSILLLGGCNAHFFIQNGGILMT